MSSALLGARSSADGWGTATQVGKSWIRFPMKSLEFFIDIILLAAFFWGGSGIESATNRNEYEEYF